ncbi:hypothetical protein EWM64_g6045 [Hericium alpestre]|uniref:Uncharacterized protein n=1 Tax=Hericium alpestre TaxID=135208 RepID=A0A4Y9ZUP6_9AGAM|nr:hypothetical protein EWM64_g6045 [Hericium alpestre]
MHLSLVDKAAFSVKWVLHTESDLHFMDLLQAVYEKLDLAGITVLKFSGNFWGGFTRINR